MQIYLLSLHCIFIHLSSAVTVWSDYSGSTSGWTIQTAPGSSSVTTTSDSSCYNSPCLFIDAGTNSLKWAQATRTISAIQYDGLNINFQTYCTCDCYFEYWCSGVSNQLTTFSVSTQQNYDIGMGDCDRNTLDIRFSAVGCSVQGSAWVDNIVLSGNTASPTAQPTQKPTSNPSPTPTQQPTQKPTLTPSSIPTQQPTQQPTSNPSLTPTGTSTAPSLATNNPSATPTLNPTPNPSTDPTAPTLAPTHDPTATPTVDPTAPPTLNPTPAPTDNPTATPTPSPTAPTLPPTHVPTDSPIGSLVALHIEPTTPPTLSVSNRVTFVQYATKSADKSYNIRKTMVALITNYTLAIILIVAAVLICITGAVGVTCFRKHTNRNIVYNKALSLSISKQANIVIQDMNDNDLDINPDDTRIRIPPPVPVQYLQAPQPLQPLHPLHPLQHFYPLQPLQPFYPLQPFQIHQALQPLQIAQPTAGVMNDPTPSPTDNESTHHQYKTDRGGIPSDSDDSDDLDDLVTEGDTYNNDSMKHVGYTTCTFISSDSNDSHDLAATIEMNRMGNNVNIAKNEAKTQDLEQILTKTWCEAMHWVRSHSAFEQHSEIINKIELFDYEYVLRKCLEIGDTKVYNKEELARIIIKNLGFDVQQQVDGIYTLYKYMIQIYRKMEEFEKQKANDSNESNHEIQSKFVHIADDIKYDDDFINNEDNLIGDFKPKDIAVTSEGVYCSYSECKHFRRIMDSLKHVMDEDMMNTSELVRYLREKHPTLLDDHIHIITNHNNIGHHLECSVKQCPSLQRYHHTTRGTITENDIDHDNDFEFYRDIMDSIHCYFFHRYDLNVRIKNAKSLRNNTKTKFVIDAHIDSRSDGVFEGLTLYMLDIGLKQHVISSIFSKLYAEEYDSDALVAAVYGKEDYTKSTVGRMVQLQYDNILRYITSLKVSDSSFSIGYVFYYWKYYQKHRDAVQYFANKNDHSGFKPHELYIEAKYTSLKEEMLHNDIYTLKSTQYNKAITKATNWINTSRKIREIKAEQNRLLHYDVPDGTSLSQENLLVITFYTDFTDLSAAFSATFRKQKSYESLKVIKERNSEYAIWSRILRETVELFGQRGPWEKRGDKVEENRWNRDHNRIKGPFFCGMKGLMVVPEFNIRLCAPTSTSADIEIARQFAKEDGTVITLNNNGHWHSDNLKIWDCSWLSKHREEEERLMIGGAYTIRIQGVRKVITNQNFECYFEPLFYYDCMMTGTAVNKHEPNIKHTYKKTLKHLIYKYCGLKSIQCNQDIDKYIHETFKAYINHKREIVINLHQIHKYFGELKDLIIQTRNTTWDCVSCSNGKGNSINSSKCHSCKQSPPSDIYGFNNILTTTVLQLFHNVNHVVIYTTVASGQHKSHNYEYVFDLNKWLDAVNVHEISNVFIRRSLKIEIKATHTYEYDEDKKQMKRIETSWLHQQWERNKNELQKRAKSMNFKLEISKTKNHGARDYLEDTLTLTM